LENYIEPHCANRGSGFPSVGKRIDPIGPLDFPDMDMSGNRAMGTRADRGDRVIGSIAFERKRSNDGRTLAKRRACGSFQRTLFFSAGLPDFADPFCRSQKLHMCN
jgi:hypothetical protein